MSEKGFFLLLLFLGESNGERNEMIQKLQDTRTWIIPTALFTVVHKGKLHPETYSTFISKSLGRDYK